MSDLEQLYDAVEQVTSELAENQPWWPCLSCPVAQTMDNCCHKAMFHVSATEWENLREHPYIVVNRQWLIKNARRQVQRLKELGHDTEDWGATISKFGQQALDFTCPLLDSQTGKCNVYDRRPLICRTYGVSFPTRDGEVFGCSIVTQAVAEHVNQQVQFVPLPEVNQYAADNVLYKPTKPIVAWLAEEKL